MPLLSVTPHESAVSHHSSPEAKITLFRSLFRGREDVYARRFESHKSGKSGYAPACANEWVRGVCEKPRIKCAECPHRRFLPITDDVIRWHLSGEDDARQPFVAGLYPMLLDETCFLLAVDFDKLGWSEDATSFLRTCRELGIDAILERSRSGRGGHVWMFFEEAIPAALARKLGAHLLTETMEQRPDAGLDSYDRFLPNQDTLPHGGFGNLIALPLQKRARDRGNSVFLDENLVPHPDQWAFLGAVKKVDRRRVEVLVENAERKGRIIGVRLPSGDEEDEPWSAAPSRRQGTAKIIGKLPRRLDVVLGDQIYVPKDALPPSLRNQMIRLAAFQNPEFYRAQAMRLPTYDKPRVIGCAEETARHLALPRGCLDEIRALLRDLGIQADLQDERFPGKPLDVSFRGELRPEQIIAVDGLAAHETGVLAATTAFGKTIVAASLIAKRGVNTLVLVHRRQLLDQWVERLSTFLGIARCDLGQIGGGRDRPNGLLDIALIQSLCRKGTVDDRVAGYGHLIVDECHHLPAWSFEQVTRRAKARFVLGLSATVVRKDGHHPIVTMQCGPIRHQVSAKRQAAMRPFQHTVIVRPTSFRPSAADALDSRAEFHGLYSELIHDEDRNRRICDDVVNAVRDGRSPLVLTERNEHLDLLASRLGDSVRNVVVMRGGMGKKQRASTSALLQAIPPDDERVLLATGKYIGEGFDDARLDTLMLTLPVSWRGTIAQYVGRLHRLNDRKREVQVYDYADLDVPMLARMFDRRCRGYEAVGYTIVVPASAIPGWPADVPLPADTTWKRDHAASVRRLIQDGVDAPLANLFLRAVEALPSEGSGTRARSASEAFLHRRLQTRPGTSGRFSLNASLPIAFDGRGQMEVDFLCADARVVVELDGAQHLSDPVAYRRDRHKDRLLQENGYVVLRFLAEDLAKDLGAMLDAIERVLARALRHP